jgi:hypothetical protein
VNLIVLGVIIVGRIVCGYGWRRPSGGIAWRLREGGRCHRNFCERFLKKKQFKMSQNRGIDVFKPKIKQKY